MLVAERLVDSRLRAAGHPGRSACATEVPTLWCLKCPLSSAHDACHRETFGLPFDLTLFHCQLMFEVSDDSGAERLLLPFWVLF